MESTTQVTVGGFPGNLQAQELAQFLEGRVGVVWRCRIKSSCTPLNAFPIFTSPEAEDDFCWAQDTMVPPHAFVHFATQEVLEEACKLAERGKLVLKNCVLKLRVGNEISQAIKRTSPPIVLSNAQVELGTLVKSDEFLISWKGPSFGVFFEVHPYEKKCCFYLTQSTLFSVPYKKKIWMKCNYKIEFLVRDFQSVRKEGERKADGGLTMILQVRIPPWIMYRTAEDDIYHATSFPLLDDEDPWIRTIDFTPDKSIGRCFAYRVTVSPRQKAQFDMAIEFFKKQQLLDPQQLPIVRLPYEKKSIGQRSEIFTVPNENGIPFEVMFLVNALVHKGIIKVTSLVPSFYNVISPSVTPIPLALSALKHIFSYKKPIFDSEKRLKQVINWLKIQKPSVVEKNLSDGILEVRRFIITPTKAYCCPPEMEVSNRVLRRYSGLADRFLRVSFLDENMHQLSPNMLNIPLAPIVRDLCTAASGSRTALYRRVKSILYNGFYLCGRFYSFLAFSASQLRDNSAWFFAEKEDIRVESIHEWMGTFPRDNVAKYAARMGQCFSATIHTVEVPPSKVEDLPDIKRNEYIFSDGIGKITPELSVEVAKVLKLDQNPPSAYQIRYGGCKGVVVTWPAEAGSKYVLSLRRSMKKFLSPHTILEIVSWTKYLPCFLNRQIVTLLSTLQVMNKVFIELQDKMVDKLSQVLDNAEVAFEVLSTWCTGDLHSTALEMLSAGFHPLSEPHLQSMLQSIKVAHLEELLKKARIYVPKGRWLMGCLDELGLLEYGECFLRVSKPSYHENCFQGKFAGVEGMQPELEVITGKIVMAKNPCLHPGDIRILQAVDKPSLHHLVDCFIMPQKGHRPHSNEASGSDLDGDLYFVCWDEELIPPSGESWDPMIYDKGENKDLRRMVKTEDLVDFFARHMVNDNLGIICNAHVVHADLSKKGALDEKCLELAELAARAVDFPKTGIVATMPQHLRPVEYPDFMDKADKICYKSEKILGILFRRVKGMVELEIEEHHRQELQNPDYFSEQFYDPDLEVEGFEEYLTEAWDHKQSYDQLLRALMGQFDVKSEGEMVTGHITTLKYNSRRQGDIRERAKSSYSALKKKFREIFEGVSSRGESEVDEDDSQCKLEEKASAWYHVTYHPNWLHKVKESSFDDAWGRHLLSFPWIAVDVLARIKARRQRAYEAYNAMVCSLGGFLDM